MALVPRPQWDPLPEPPGPDPATLQEFQLLAAGDMSPLELAADQVGVGVAGVDVTRLQSEAATEQLGRDLAESAVELQAMGAEADADTLVLELGRASEQDGALLVVAGEVATALGEAPPVPEPQPAPPAPPPPPSSSMPIIGPMPRF